MTGSIGTVSKLAVLSITVLVLVGSTGFSGAYFSDQASSDGGRISAADPKPTRGDLKFTPKSLSTTNQGTTTIHLEQPAGSTIDPESAVATVDGRSVDAPVRTCNPQKCLFEPTAQAVIDAGGAGEPTLEVTATLENGSELEASTTVRIFEPGGRNPGLGPSRDQGDSDEQGVDPETETVESAIPGPDEGESSPDSIERSSNGSNESASERPGVETGTGGSTASENESGWSGTDPENDTADGESGAESTPNATSADERTADPTGIEETKSGEPATSSSDRDETASDEESFGTSDTNGVGTDSDAGTDSATKVDAEVDETETDSEVDDTDDIDDARLDAETTATTEAETDERSSRRSDGD
ncbi:hypothetical protein [Halostagnicola kamekurae]|uniref:Uncharacterized protein n=1 Tax=Halostagnicola kamekurae TaxID=619731 RepID=A0A1I6Q657_9EURY|nr:hypothetical protein [Halostagnicola kamekurae]SFS47949.1 hypothetical protein SAMN04488556_1011 [Halostagnicola kamekurae]